MQIERAHFAESVVTFARGGGAAPSRDEGARPAAESLRAVLSPSERLSGPDPSQDAQTG